MVNKIIDQRCPALSMACIASSALILAAFAGTSCEFLEINSKADSLILEFNDVELIRDETTNNLGVFCKSSIFEPQVGDNMWGISRIFFIVGMTLGSLSTVLAWALTFCLPPTSTSWKILSIMSAFTAVLQVPVFLVFESEPCSKFKSQQECTFASGSFFLITSIVAWVGGVLCTQCFDTPQWGMEISAWKAGNDEIGEEEYRNDDEELGENYRITRIGPADATYQSKKSKTGRWTWFSDSRSKNPKDLKAISTESFRYDDDDDYDERDQTDAPSPSLYDSSVDPRRKGKGFASVEDLDALAQLAEEGKFENSPKKSPMNGSIRKSPQNKGTEGGNRITIITTTPGGNDKVVSSYPAYQDEPLMPRLPSKSNDRNQSPSPVKDGERKKVSPMKSPPVEDTNPLITTSEEKNSKGIRKMANNFKKASRRRRSRRKQRQGYDVLDDDQSTDSYPYVSPPLQININLFEHQNNIALLDTKDEEDLMDDWKALHEATTAGVRLGLQEGAGSFDEAIDYDISAYHSDPEPVIYSSDDSGTEVTPRDLDALNPQGFKREDDNSTLSSRSWSKDSSKKKRGRKMGRGRRKRRHRSPIGSLKSSGSLMGTTIDEETVQDILEESSAGEGESGLHNTYELSRTVSAPEARRTGFDRNGLKRGRRPLAQQISPPRSARQRQLVKENVSNNQSANRTNYKVSGTNVISPEKPPRDQGSVKTMPTRGPLLRGRSMNAYQDIRSRPRAQSVSSMKGRAMSMRSRRNEDDSLSSKSSGDKVPQTARELRRRRLLNQSLSTETSSGQESNLNTSNLSKNNVIAVTPENSPFKSTSSAEEKIDLDVPEDEYTSFREKMDTAAIESSVVTPDYEPKGYFFQEEKLDDGKESVLTPEVPDDESEDGQLKLISLIDNALPMDPGKASTDVKYSEELGSITSDSLSSTHSDKYGSAMLDELDLQLIEIRRPTNVEYGAEEASM